MCCGQNREAARVAARGVNTRPDPGSARAASSTSVIVFEYVGSGTTTIRGPASGAIYRFARQGDRVRVDPRDRPGLLDVRTLRWIRAG